MKRLFIFPESPGEGSGYQIAVKSDISRIKPRKEDVFLFYTQKDIGDAGIRRFSKFSYKRIFNILRGRTSTELLVSDLARKVKGKEFNTVFCGDIIVYRAAKKLFPKARFIIRFHNFFSLSVARNNFLQYSLNIVTAINFRTFAKLESEILKDKNLFPIFITKEEASFFKLMYPIRKHRIWKISPSIIRNEEKKVLNSLKIVWFGGVSSHKAPGINYFIENIFPQLLKKNKNFELHLFGSGTLQFNNPSRNIWGHGYYQGQGLPYDGNAFFINPDLLGGGVKVKINQFIKNHTPLITTPFGIEGYSDKEISELIIADISDWESEIIKYFNKQNLLT